MAAWTFFAAGLAYLTVTLLREPWESADFRYIWTAGDVWARHGNPYGPEYPATGERRFPTSYPVRSWVYPFHWYLPARFAAAFDPPRAYGVWVVFNAALLALAGWLAWRGARFVEARWPITAVAVAIGYACSSTPLTFLLRHGHPAGLAVVGVAIVAFGVTTRRPYLTAVGAALAMLKPHLGVPILTALLFMPGGLLAATLGGAITLLASMPAFAAAGFWPQVEGLLRQSTEGYQGVTYNSPGAMSGLPHMLLVMTGRQMGIGASMLLAALLAAAATRWVHAIDDRRRAALFVAFGCSITATVVSLHGYDLTILLVALPLLPLLAPREMLIAGAGYALLWRPEKPRAPARRLLVHADASDAGGGADRPRLGAYGPTLAGGGTGSAGVTSSIASTPPSYPTIRALVPDARSGPVAGHAPSPTRTRPWPSTSACSTVTTVPISRSRRSFSRGSSVGTGRS